MVRAGDVGKVAEWQSRLRRFAASGASVAKFCLQEGVSAPSFYLWRKRLKNATVRRPRGPAARQPFVPVRLTGTTSRPIEIRLPNGVRLRLPGDNLEALRASVEMVWSLRDTTLLSDKEAARC